MMHPGPANTPYLHDIHIGGQRLEAARWAGRDPDAPSILLLHEGLGCVALWRDFPTRLAAATGLTVTAWSRAGYGHSSPCPLPRPQDYMEQEARRLPEVLRAMDIEHHILIGHSDGASIAALAAAETAPGLLGTVLMAPHFFVEDISIAAIDAAREAYVHDGLRARLAKYHAHPDVAFHGWNDAWLDPRFRAWNIEHAIPHWRVPVLSIQGEDDPYGSSAQLDATRASGMDPEICLIPACGHAPHLEAPETTLDHICRFIRRCTGQHSLANSAL